MTAGTLHITSLAQTGNKPSGYGGLDAATQVFDPKYFDSTGVIDLKWLFVVGSFVLLALLMFWAYRVMKMRHLRSAPLLVFHQIAGALGVGLSEQWLLHKIASHEKLPSPLTLLLAPGTFDHHLAAYLQTLSASAQQSVNGRASSIKAKVFGE